MVHIELSGRCDSFGGLVGYLLGSMSLLMIVPIVAMSDTWTETLLHELVAVSTTDSLDDVLPAAQERGETA